MNLLAVLWKIFEVVMQKSGAILLLPMTVEKLLVSINWGIKLIALALLLRGVIFMQLDWFLNAYIVILALPISTTLEFLILWLWFGDIDCFSIVTGHIELFALNESNIEFLFKVFYLFYWFSMVFNF